MMKKKTVITRPRPDGGVITHTHTQMCITRPCPYSRVKSVKFLRIGKIAFFWEPMIHAICSSWTNITQGRILDSSKSLRLVHTMK